MKQPIMLEILKVINVKRKFVHEPLRLGLVSLRIDRDWNVNESYKMRHKAAFFIIRWPRFLMIRLDLAEYRVDGFLEPHIDHTPENVYQFNSILVLKSPTKGGELISEKFVYKGRFLKIIETNRYTHELTRIEEGTRRVLNLSVRFALKKLDSPPF